MSNRNKHVLILALAAGLIAGMYAAPEHAAAQTALAYGHDDGESLIYDITITSQVSQAVQKFNAAITQNIAIEAGDVMAITTSLNSPSLTVNGIPYPYSLSGTMLSSKVQRNGHVNETTALGDFQSLLSNAGFTSFTNQSPDIFSSLGILELPAASVSTGTVWSITKTQSFPNGGSVNLVYTYTVQSLGVSYRGYTCAQIGISAQPKMSYYLDLPKTRKGSMTSGQVQVSGTLLFDTQADEGRVVKLDETVITNSVGVIVGFDGMATIVPNYQRTIIAVEIR